VPHIPAEAEAILKFLGAVAGFIFTVVGGYKRIADTSRKKAADAVEREYVDEPPTRRMPTLPEGEQDTPEARLRFLSDRCAHLLERLTQERFAHSEAAKLSDARERALEAELKSTREELRLARSDLAVATSARIVAEKAGLEIRRQWKAAQGLDSDAPPADPRSSSAITKPPPKPQ
jgi:hypothetical protein